MPREKKPRQELLKSWIESDYDLFADVCITGNDLFCNLCGGIINSCKKSNVTRHLKSHASSSESDDPTFFYDLTVAFLASDIPLNKLGNPTLRHFLEKYIDRKLPDSSTLRNRYVDQIYEDVLQNIRNDVGEHFVYFIVDEATDASGRSVANFLIGALKSDSASGSYLVASKILDRTDHKTIIDFVIECFYCIWPNQDYSQKVLVMLTDDIAYMRKAGILLMETFPNMIHFTCAVHALNHIAETISDCFPLVNKVIANVKKIFVKAPTHRAMFREVLPDVPFPPKPVVTRWCTWLEAVAYYDKYFEELKRVTYRFDPNESSTIHTVQNLLKLQSIRDDFRYINSNYSILITAIKKLETYGLSLEKQFMVLDAVKQIINNNNTHEVSAVVKKELLEVFTKNPGYSRLEYVYLFLKGTHKELPPSLEKYRPYIFNFSYCPLVTVDVEGTCSLRKLLLRDRRRGFTEENLKKYLVINFYYRHRDTCQSEVESETEMD